MDIVLIDDDVNALTVTQLLLEGQGHAVMEYADPREALDALSDNGRVDLVVTDVQMDFLDGFEVAQKVAELRGTTPPMVLLISGYPSVKARMHEIPPSVVIGLLPKPFEAAALARVMSVLEQSRTQCPGLVEPFCQCKDDVPRQKDDTEAGSRPCATIRYSECSHYNESCGRTLRLWISTEGLTG